MIETMLSEMGWQPAGKCNCNMTLNLKFSKGYWLLYYMPKRRQFFMKFDGNRVTSPMPTGFLLKYINENTQDPFAKKAL
jgi:hypothetical protein